MSTPSGTPDEPETLTLLLNLSALLSTPWDRVPGVGAVVVAGLSVRGPGRGCGMVGNWVNCPGFPLVTRAAGMEPRVRSLGLCRSEGVNSGSEKRNSPRLI
jgi:hypothetical protein